MQTFDKKFNALQEYFNRRPDVLMAFLLGSRAKGQQKAASDWDIGVYVKPNTNATEWEVQRDFPQENELLGDIVKTLGTDNVDMLILNRVPATKAAAAINGMPIVIKDRKTYLDFLLAVTREAEDFREFTKDYAEIYWRSKSLTEQDKKRLREWIIFLDAEFKDIEKYKTFTLLDYEQDKAKKREIERWVENIINALIDIAKIIVASEKQPLPETYRETIERLGILSYLTQEDALHVASFTKLRNILAHEYLDLRWKEMTAFISSAQPIVERFIEKVKSVV